VFQRWMIASLLGLSVASSSFGAEPNALGAKIEALAKAHKGQVAVAVKRLDTGETYAWQGDKPMPTASLIKVAIMVEAYWQAHEKKTDLTQHVKLEKDDRVPGAGILTYHFSDSASFPLRDAIRLMIVYSDNTATNLVLDRIGLPATAARMETLGLKETKIHSKVYKRETSVFPERSKLYGLGSTTAKEMVQLLELIETGKVVSPEACKQMLEHLKANNDKDMMVRNLPAGTIVAHKTGAVSNARTDAGIMYIPDAKDPKVKRPVVLCVLTNENADERYVRDNAAQVLIGNIAKEVHDYFKAQPK
jgi:beta-lactamase class A